MAWMLRRAVQALIGLGSIFAVWLWYMRPPLPSADQPPQASWLPPEDMAQPSSMTQLPDRAGDQANSTPALAPQPGNETEEPELAMRPVVREGESEAAGLPQHEQSPLEGTEPPQMRTSVPELLCCRYAYQFDGVNWSHPGIQERFEHAVMDAERRFFGAKGVAFDETTGMTFDGHFLDPATGDLNRGRFPAGPRVWSAASKESMHLSLLALALAPPAAGRPVQAEALLDERDALETLELKVKSMEDFDSTYPGFGGFLPWFCSRGVKYYDVEKGGGIVRKAFCRDSGDTAAPIGPTHDWQDRVPALDNGQLAWATYAVTRVLEERAPTCSRSAALAKRWNRRLQRMRDTAVPLFYHGRHSGLVRSVAQIKDTSVDAAVPGNAAKADDPGPGFLDDPYEGELMVLFMDLLAAWPGYGDGNEEKQAMWRNKKAKLAAVEYSVAGGASITVQQGHWFSAHEQWKLLVLPYLDLPILRRLFANCERARLHHSAERGIPGLFASVTPPEGHHCEVMASERATRSEATGYCSATGVGAVAREEVRFDHVVTPYGAFPAILADRATGFAWYNRMLQLPRMQTAYGSVESAHVDGTAIAPIMTWDAKVTTVLAMLGGTSALLREHLRRDGLLGRFNDTISEFYLAEFGDGPLLGEELPFQPPPRAPQTAAQAALGTGASDGPVMNFPSCTCQQQQAEQSEQSEKPQINI